MNCSLGGEYHMYVMHEGSIYKHVRPKLSSGLVFSRVAILGGVNGG